MSLKITETGTGHVSVSQERPLAAVGITLDHGEQRELLEALARVHGFSLVDHVERRELTSLVEEVRHPERLPEPNIHLVRSNCSWRRTAKALAEAVAQTLDLED